MTFKRVATLLVVATLLPLTGCVNYIDSEEYKKESNLLLTAYDTAYYNADGPQNPNTHEKIAFIDTVFVQAHDSLKIDTIPQSTIDSVIGTTTKQLQDRGFDVTIFSYDELEALDSTQRDSLLNEFDIVAESYVAFEEYTYYTYWGGYWGYYWWYYPGYVTSSTYRTADLFITLSDTKNISPKGEMDKMWRLRMNDLVRNDKTATVDRKVSDLIRDGFAQSQYLKVN